MVETLEQRLADFSHMNPGTKLTITFEQLKELIGNEAVDENGWALTPNGRRMVLEASKANGFTAVENTGISGSVTFTHC